MKQRPKNEQVRKKKNKIHIEIITGMNPKASFGTISQQAAGSFTLLKRVGLKSRLTVTGGCAKNQGLLMELKRLFQIDIAPLTVDPQLIGALLAPPFLPPGRDNYVDLIGS